MLAAEKDHPLKALDKSVQPPPEELTAMDGGATWDGRDDEALGRLPDLPPGEAPAQQQQQERRHRGGLLGWLFGSGDEDEAPPPPPRSDR
jgi:hypothetical protein